MPQGPWQSRKKCVTFLRAGVRGRGSPENRPLSQHKEKTNAQNTNKYIYSKTKGEISDTLTSEAPQNYN